MPKKFPLYQQHDQMDCGPTCLRMVAKHYGRSYGAQELREWTQIGKDGVNLLGISEAAERIGFRATGVKLTLQKLIDEAPLPCIVHWEQSHFVVLVEASHSPMREFLWRIWGGRNVKKTDDEFSNNTEGRQLTNSYKARSLVVADPARGLVTYGYEEFEKQWATTLQNSEKLGVALLLELTALPPDTATQSNGAINSNNNKSPNAPIRGRGAFGASFYLWQQRRLLGQLAVGLLVASLLQLIFPFLTQSVVDVGIQTRNPSFVLLVLIAQLVLTFSRMSVEFIRSWLLMHLSTRLNLSLLSDFLIKLTRLPLSFFDTK